MQGRKIREKERTPVDWLCLFLVACLFWFTPVEFLLLLLLANDAKHKKKTEKATEEGRTPAKHALLRDTLGSLYARLDAFLFLERSLYQP